MHIDLGEPFRARFKNPYAVVHRGDLHGVFVRACRAHDKIELKVDGEVVDYQQDGKQVTVRLASGETHTGIGLIGSDGLWSNVGEQGVPDGPRGVAEHNTYRSLIPIELMQPNLRWKTTTL